MNDPRLPNAKRPPIPKELRDFVMNRDGGHCRYCGSADLLTLDHVFPFIQGGSTTAENLVVACRTDNLIASDRVFPELAEKIAWVKWARGQLGKAIIEKMNEAFNASEARTVLENAPNLPLPEPGYWIRITPHPYFRSFSALEGYIYERTPEAFAKRLRGMADGILKNHPSGFPDITDGPGYEVEK